jgi:Holliday junction resolvasome RuvABC endonuclease subunit
MKLALDLGTTTGFAWSSARGAMVSGTWDFRPKKYEGAGMRYLRFHQALDALHARATIEVVWFEAVRRHIGTDAAHVYGGLMGHLESWCEKQNPKVPYEGIPVGTIKKSWTGKGNASKDEMMAECVRRGFEPDDDNEADAIAILARQCPEAIEPHIDAPASEQKDVA